MYCKNIPTLQRKCGEGYTTKKSGPSRWMFAGRTQTINSITRLAMSQKCSCTVSRFSPHRADKCTFARNKKKPAAPPAPLAPSHAEEAKESAQEDDLPAPPTVNCSNETEPAILNDFIFVGESTADSDEGSTSPAPEEDTAPMDSPLPPDEDVAGEDDEPSQDDHVPDDTVPEVDEAAAAENSTFQNGNEQCDCIAYRVKRHRKKNCKWKRHTIIGLVLASVVAAGAVAAVALASKGDDEDDLSAGVENINFNSPHTEESAAADARRAEEERLRTERETAERAAAQREREEREARLRAEDEQRRQMAAQQARMDAQERENQRLRAEIRAAQRANQTFHQQSHQQNNTYNQQSYQFHTTQHNTYSTSSYSAPTYNMTHNSRGTGGGRSQVGTTLKGTPCKNCLKQGGRCHQHR